MRQKRPRQSPSAGPAPWSSFCFRKRVVGSSLASDPMSSARERPSYDFAKPRRNTMHVLQRGTAADEWPDSVGVKDGTDDVMATARLMHTLDLVICRQLPGASRRSDRTAGVGAARSPRGLALDGRSYRQPVVSDGEAVPSAQSRRLGSGRAKDHRRTAPPRFAALTNACRAMLPRPALRIRLPALCAARGTGRRRSRRRQ